MEELFRTTDPTEIPFAKALLASEDIDCFEIDVHMSMLEGSIGIMPRRLMVARKDLFMAKDILRKNGFDLNGR